MRNIDTQMIGSATSVVALLLLMLAPAIYAADVDATNELAPRIAMVRTLLFESSAARRIENSEDEPAKLKRQQAISTFEEAIVPGDIDTRKAKLNDAVALLYASAALVSNNSGSDQKYREDLDRRQRSLDALLLAHERIMVEKGTADEHTLLLADIDADTRAVETLLAANKIDQAREHLDRAYEKTRLSVEQSREGETLLRELKFETPEDEFRYELDRNDTHRMLLTVLLQEKMQNERVKDRVHSYVEEADKLRESATEQASDERFEEAIELLERSTAELVRAIRGAGVYIPG